MSACAAGYPDHVDPDVALAFADRALAAAERAEVERRIDACPGCRAAIAEAARDASMATKRERPASARPPRPSASGELSAGDSVGRYIVERPLGAGGMGVVSLARDPELRRAVVIKLVRPDVYDVEFEARLRREAQAQAQLSHPNVVQIFDIGRHGDRVFLAMEFIAGQTLDAWLIERERSPDEIIAMFLQAGAGLEAAHRAGLLHRDFKPANVLVDRNGVAKVTDFGLARSLATTGRQTSAMPAPMTGVHAVLTQQDSVVGTPAYMAPEQAAGQPLDARTDQFALALSLLDGLVGQLPTRRAVSPMADPAALDEALAQARIAERVRGAIVRALRIDPADRFPDIASFLRELAPPRERRRWPLVAGAAAIVGVGGLVAFLALRSTAASVCKPEAPAAWQAAPRAAVHAKLVARPRVFASWHAEHVLAQLDAAAAELGALEVERCEGKAVDTACLAKRRGALFALADRPLDDTRAELAAVMGCDADADRVRAISELRAQLAGADAAVARSLADRAGDVDDDLLRADALEHAARQALAHGFFREAAADVTASLSAAERAGDDSLRARALLTRLELARMRADLDVAHETVRQLGGMLERHRDQPADVFVVALAAAHAFTELGDAEAAFAQIERARANAKTPDETLRARLARARALDVLRWDAAGTDRELAAALATSGASTAARADALAFAVDLAIAHGDAAAAAGRLTELLAVRPDDVRAARVRALAGEATAALADLGRVTASDATTRARVDIASAEILLRAGRPAEARRVLGDLISRTREPTTGLYDYERVGLSTFERIHAWYLRCDAAFAEGVNRDCYTPNGLDQLHRAAPLRARHELNEFRHEKRAASSYARLPLRRAVEILTAAKIEPLVLAELQLELVRIDPNHHAREEVARAARHAFAAAGRTSEVAELDAILGR